MIERECPREQELIDEIAAGRYPDTAPASVREHVAACASCRELADMVTLLQEDRAAAITETALPSAGQVWWRAELRARQEAAHTAHRPMTLMLGLAWAATIAVLLAFGALLGPFAGQWLDHASWLSTTPAVDLGRLLIALQPWSGVFAIAGIAWLVLAPVAVYLLLRGD